MKTTARWRRTVAWVAVLLTLAAVLTLYTRADFLLMLADQLWACF
jgi:hypothetical protein